MNNLNKLIVTNIIDISMISSSKGRFAEMNNRKDYGLSFCKEGEIIYTHNNTNYKTL